MDSVSVVLRARNEARWIGYTIQSLLERLASPEIIVVDDHSTDDTVTIVKHFMQDRNLSDHKAQSYTDIKIITIDEYSPGRAINLGVAQSTREYVLVISSHCELESFSLAKHQDDLKQLSAIFGNQIPIWHGKKITKRYMWSHFVDQEVINMYSEYEKRYFLHNAVALYRTSFLRDNPFDEQLMGKEDRYWANEMIKAKRTILYDPSMSVKHHYTSNGNTWKGLA